MVCTHLFPIKCYKICYNMLHNHNDKTISKSLRKKVNTKTEV